MNTLSRYVFGNFLKPLVFSYLALTSLVLTAELMERLDKILAAKAGPILVARYLLALWPVRSLELIPVAALLAALFCLGQMSRRMEIVAALSGGVHPWRITAPLLWVGTALSFLSLGLGEAVLPWANRQVKSLWNIEIRQLTARRPTRFASVTVAGKDGALFAIGTLDISDERLRDVVVDLPARGKPRIQYHAQEARWTESGWVFLNGVERRFAADGRAMTRQRPFQELATDLRDHPRDLVPDEPRAAEMNQRELRSHLERLRRLGMATRRFEVELYAKGAMPWANLIVLFLGIPLSFNKRLGKVRAVAEALAMAFAYFGLLQVGRALGQKPWCPPVAGAWLANIVFLAMGARLYWRMRSLG